MGQPDGRNPNGGGALQRWEEAEGRRGARAAQERLEMNLRAMDEEVSRQIKVSGGHNQGRMHCGETGNTHPHCKPFDYNLLALFLST